MRGLRQPVHRQSRRGTALAGIPAAPAQEAPRGAGRPQAEPHVGTRLWRDAARHGARAIGQPVGAIEVGRRADWLVLDRGAPLHGGAAPRSRVDHLVFAGGAAAIRDVMVAGRWVVKERRHAAEADSRAALRDARCSRLGPTAP